MLRPPRSARRRWWSGFRTLPPLGRCNVDEALTTYLVPFSNSSASKALRSLVRGNLLDVGIRYVVMTLHSYTHQPYADLPVCFAGWMARSEAGSGEVYEPRTVQDRLDLTANTRIAVPLLINVAERKVVWCDLALKNAKGLQNNVATSEGGIQRALQSLVQVTKPNLYDLFLLHVEARGEWVATPEEAERVFSVENGTPFRQEEITSEYLR